MRRSLLLAALVGLFISAPVAGQEDLSRVLDTIAAMWSRGDANAIAGLAANRGIEIEVHGASLGRVSGRKASAAVRHLFADQETVTVRASMTSRVTGTDRTAFAELSWVMRPRGSMVLTRNTVFLGLVREGTGWRVSQIRVLR